jgi:NAD(P)H-nitrite reductase large subunit
MSKQNSLDNINSADIVIVGNGITGLTAALESRRLAPEKNIVIMTDQSHPTINTPALKQYAIGKMEREQLLAYPAGTEHLQRIHVVNAHVEAIHAREGYIRLAGGRGFGYEKLLLATGSSPTGLANSLPGRDFDGVLTLHRLPDYLDLRRRLNEVSEAVVIGGGVHAVETVMSMLYWDIQVHWLIRSKTFMPRILDRTASDMVLEGIRRAGVKIYTETEVVGVVGRVGVVAGVVTSQQKMIPCNLVLVCTGTSPATGLARNSDVPMKQQNGILVDDQLRTSVRNIYAAGDVAALRDPLTGQYSPRAQWYAVASQGRTVAAAMTGEKNPKSSGVSWHATRLGDLSMLTVGNTLSWPAEIAPLTERRKGRYCRLMIIDNRLVGYLSLGAAQPDSLAIKRIIDEGLSVREITKSLLRGEFDARKFFSGKRSYAVQRMITTGQLPTPLPPIPGIIAGQSNTLSRLSAPLEPVLPRTVGMGRTPEPPRRPTTEPLAQTMSNGRIPTTPARTNFLNSDDRPQIAAQRTLIDESFDARSTGSARGKQEELLPAADRQFITLPRTPAYKPTDSAENAHPSRSLWHYTNKLPAVTRRDNVQN